MKLSIYSTLFHLSVVAAGKCKPVEFTANGEAQSTKCMFPTLASKQPTLFVGACFPDTQVNIALGTSGQHGKLQIQNADPAGLDLAFGIKFLDAQRKLVVKAYLVKNGESCDDTLDPNLELYSGWATSNRALLKGLGF